VAYLTEAEIEQYCRTIPGVTMTEVEIASGLIDSFVGKTFDVQTVTETVHLNRQRRGKLNSVPVVSIDKVVAKGHGMFGLTTEELSVNDIELDGEGDGRFTYYGSGGLNNLIYGGSFHSLTVTYKSGYAQYPKNLKLACAMLAQNVKQRSSFGGEKTIYSLDYRVEMSDDSFFTSDIKMLLKGL